MSCSLLINYDDSSALSFNSTYVLVDGTPEVTLQDLGGGTYTTTPQLVTSQQLFQMTRFNSFAQSATLPSGTSIQYQIVLDGNPYWFNSISSAWELSDGTYAQSNAASVVNSNATTLIDQSVVNIKMAYLRVWLATTNAAHRPLLVSNTVGYNRIIQTSPAISTVTVTGSLADLAAGVPLPTTQNPVVLNVSCDHAFFYNSFFVEPFTKSFNFDNTGAVSAVIMETATPGVKLNFSISYYDGLSLKTSRLFSAIVPNSGSVNLSDIATIFPVDFG